MIIEYNQIKLNELNWKYIVEHILPYTSEASTCLWNIPFLVYRECSVFVDKLGQFRNVTGLEMLRDVQNTAENSYLSFAVELFCKC